MTDGQKDTVTGMRQSGILLNSYFYFSQLKMNKMKVLTNDQAKIDIVSQLVKEGNIDFGDALKLLEQDESYGYVPPYHQPVSPFTMPVYPGPIWVVDWWNTVIADSCPTVVEGYEDSSTCSVVKIDAKAPFTFTSFN